MTFNTCLMVQISVFLLVFIIMVKPVASALFIGLEQSYTLWSHNAGNSSGPHHQGRMPGVPGRGYIGFLVQVPIIKDVCQECWAVVI